MDHMLLWTSGTKDTYAVSSPLPNLSHLTRPVIDHSDPSGLYSYRRQPERVLFALDKLVTVLSPIIGYENLHRTPSAGWSDGKTKDDVTAWNEKAEEVMKGWEEGFWNVEKRCEKAGWSKVCKHVNTFISMT